MVISIGLKWDDLLARAFFVQHSATFSAKLESAGYWNSTLATGVLQLLVLVLSSATAPATKLYFSGSASSSAFVEKGVPNLVAGQFTLLLERA